MLKFSQALREALGFPSLREGSEDRPVSDKGLDKLLAAEYKGLISSPEPTAENHAFADSLIARTKRGN